MIKRRMAVFKRKGRKSKDYIELRDKCRDMIDKAKEKWYKKEEEKLTTPGAHQLSFKALRNIRGAEREEEWAVDELDPTKTQQELAEDLATYFSKISQEQPSLSNICLLYTSDAADE